MILKDYIDNVNSEYVYIGAKNAFLAIGKTKDFDSLIEEADTYHRTYIEKQLQELYDMQDNIPKRYEWTERIVKTSKERIKTTQQLLEEMTQALKELTEYVNGTPTTDRVTAFSEEYAKLEDKYEQLLAKHVANGMVNALRRMDQVHASEEDIAAKIPVLEAKLDAFIPFEEREVISEYKRIMQKPYGTIIIIDGDERGRYWSLDEVGKDISELEDEDEEDE